LYLLREKPNIHSPGAYLLSVLRNDHANKEDARSSLDEITSNEINEINRSERIARRIYYQKMEEDRLPKEESLKWIRKIKEQLRDKKMRCQPCKFQPKTTPYFTPKVHHLSIKNN
jgi:hypothetical protein